MTTASLYEPLIGRDLDAIPDAVRTFRETHSSPDLLQAVTRFAVLAYSPSEHSKRAVMACLALNDLAAQAGDSLDALTTECAVYASASRQPWSEPPIGEPPAVGADEPGGLENLHAAIANHDRLAGERWLARRLNDPALASDYFAAAVADLSDMGDQLLMALTAWRLAGQADPRGRFAILRIGIWEMTAHHRAADVPPGTEVPPLERLAPDLIADLVAQQGSVTASQAIFLLDAAMQTENEDVVRRISAFLGRQRSDSATVVQPVPAVSIVATNSIPVYRLARDYASSLLIRAVASRWSSRFPELDPSPMIEACDQNLALGPSFEEWSLA